MLSVGRLILQACNASYALGNRPYILLLLLREQVVTKNRILRKVTLKTIRLIDFALILIIVASSAGCGGGGGGTGGSSSTTTIEAARLQFEGPGDVKKYFPLSQGDRWTFKVTTVESGKIPIVETETMEITGKKFVDGYETSVMTYSGSSVDDPGEEYYLKTGAGLFYLGSSNAGPLEKANVPYQVFHFPMQLNDSFVQLNSKILDYGMDLDGDGQNEKISIDTVVKVAGFETVTVEAGIFPESARIETTITETLYLSRSGSKFIGTGREVDWYAPTAGSVKKHIEFTVQGQSSSTDYELVACKVAGYKSDTTLPSVVSTQPGRGAILTPPEAVKVVFSEDMDPSSLNSASFFVTDSSFKPVPGTVSYANKTASFTPSAPLISGTYTATVTTSLQDLAENKLTADSSWSFIVDATAPGVISTTPANGAINVMPSMPITVTFSEPMSTNNLSFEVKDSNNGYIYGNFTYNGNTVTFTPDWPLLYNNTYTITLATMLQDLAGNRFPGTYSWSFTTSTNGFLPYLTLPTTGSWPGAVAIGDVNSDGRSDVVLITHSGLWPTCEYKLNVYLQNVAGGLDPPVKYAIADTAQTVAIGDVNNDGRNEVVVGGSDQIQVLSQTGSGGLNLSANYPSTDVNKIRIADLNNDGLLDIAGIGSATGNVTVWLQNGSGTLNSPVIYTATRSKGVDIRVADISNDGLNDIIVTNGDAVGVLTQRADGSFNPAVYYSSTTPATAGSAPRFFVATGIAVGDVTSDSLNDVVLSGPGLYIYPQNGSGTLNSFKGYSSQDPAGQIEVVDIDNDGRKDIVIYNKNGGALGVYRPKADGTLFGEEQFNVPMSSQYNPYEMAVGDINGDGLKDVVISNYDYGLVLVYAGNASATQKIVAKRAANSKNAAPATLFRAMKIRKRSF